jgi:RNA polymerase sigma factor (sigma-70 family)
MLEILIDRHSEWISMAKSICKDINIANDLVQDMYLRLNKYIDNPEKIIQNDKVNSFFIYITLRNIFYDYKKAEKSEINKDYSDAESLKLLSSMAEVPEKRKKDDAMEEAYLKIFKAIDKEVSSWHWYDQKLFRLYYYTNKSLRDIADDTKISLTSIYNSCKNYRIRLKEKLGEDIEDYFNEDYDKI